MAGSEFREMELDESGNTHDLSGFNEEWPDPYPEVDPSIRRTWEWESPVGRGQDPREAMNDLANTALRELRAAGFTLPLTFSYSGDAEWARVTWDQKEDGRG